MSEIIGGFGAVGKNRSKKKDHAAFMNDAYSMMLESAIVDSAEEAWESYRKAESQFFKFVRGYKYWRRRPELQSNKDFDAGTIEYRVRARIFSVMEELPGVPQAKIEEM